MFYGVSRNSTKVCVRLLVFLKNNCTLATLENIKSILKINVFSSSWSTEEDCHRRKNNYCYSKRGISTTSRYLILSPWNNLVFPSSFFNCMSSLMSLPLPCCSFICLSENFKIKYYPLSARNTEEESSWRKKTYSSERGGSSTT